MDFEGLSTITPSLHEHAPRHRGISVLIIDMKAPGVRVRPLPEGVGKSGG